METKKNNGVKQKRQNLQKTKTFLDYLLTVWQLRQKVFEELHMFFHVLFMSFNGKATDKLLLRDRTTAISHVCQWKSRKMAKLLLFFSRWLKTLKSCTTFKNVLVI